MTVECLSMLCELSASITQLRRDLVGASRFERPTTRTPSEYATGLRHAPTGFLFLCRHILALKCAGLQPLLLDRPLPNRTKRSPRSPACELPRYRHASS